MQCNVFDSGQIFKGGPEAIGSFTVHLDDFVRKSTASMIERLSGVRDNRVQAILDRLYRVQSSGLADIVLDEGDRMMEYQSIEQFNVVNESISVSRSSLGDQKLFSSRRSTKPVRDEIIRFPKANQNGEEVLDDEFIELGYNSKSNGEFLHYRLVIQTPLEDTDYMSNTYQSISIFKGKSMVKDERGWLGNLLKASEAHKKVGSAVLSVEIVDPDILGELSKLDIPDLLKTNHISLEEGGRDEIDEAMMKESQFTVRVYIVDIDIFDDYEREIKFEISLDERKIEDKSINDGKNLHKIYKSYSIKHQLPSKGLFSIEVNGVGVVQVDVDRRFLDKKFRSIPHYPVESHKIIDHDTESTTGMIRMWIELVDEDSIKDEVKSYAGKFYGDLDKLIKSKQVCSGLREMEADKPKYKTCLNGLGLSRYLWDISPLPAVDVQLRVVIWEASDVPIDDPEGKSDIYITASLPSYREGLTKKSDTHIRSEGYGSWNTRMLFDISLDRYVTKENFLMSFQIWDKDLLSKNDYLCSHDYHEIFSIIQKCIENGKSYTQRGKGNENEIILKCKNQESTKTANLTISISCVTKEEAIKNPVGEGQSDPNQNPFLPKPKGRLEFSFNPIVIINQLFGREFLNKVICYLCGGCFCILIIASLPLLFSNLMMVSVGIQPY